MKETRKIITSRQVCPPKPSESPSWTLLMLKCCWKLQLLRLSQRLRKASPDHLLAAYIKRSHRFMFSSLKWFTAAPQSLTDSLQPAAVFASNSRFMTQGDNMHQAILSVSRASIMYISSLSQTFHLSCFHLLMHHVGMVCLSGREATYCTHTPAVPAITCLKLILI